MFMFLNIFVSIFIAFSMNALQAETLEIRDQRSQKNVVFTNEFTEQNFQEVIDFLVKGHVREYPITGIELSTRFEDNARAHWASYYASYFLNQHSGQLITARVDGEIVGACVYYPAQVTVRHAQVPTLCIIDAFSECERYEPRTFMKGYRALALKHCPTAVRWLVGAHKDALRYHEAYEQAGFKKTSTHLPHLNAEQRVNSQGFTRRVSRKMNTNVMDVD